ncbi:MAG: DUF2530 domain-containing protein [Marmoricola sp.]|nr:DUF2530 domain-containing protein [Marmoricola sp.]
MRPEDEQPKVHEIGNRTYIVADVEPLDVDGVRTMQVGTALWAVALVVLLLLRHHLEKAGHGWWVWVAVVGLVLGLIGWEHTTRRRRRRHRANAAAEASSP